MGPLVASALIKTGGDLLSGLFAPSPKKKMQWERENAQKMATWRAGQVTSALKPQTPYYTSGNLPQLGTASMQAVMGNLARRMGPELMAKWGINPAVTPPPAPAPVPNYTVGGMKPGFPGQVPQGFPGQEILMRRYLPQGA
jgi:hypothetical protein